MSPEAPDHVDRDDEEKACCEAKPRQRVVQMVVRQLQPRRPSSRPAAWHLLLLKLKEERNDLVPCFRKAGIVGPSPSKSRQYQLFFSGTLSGVKMPGNLGFSRQTHHVDGSGNLGFWAFLSGLQCIRHKPPVGDQDFTIRGLVAA